MRYKLACRNLAACRRYIALIFMVTLIAYTMIYIPISRSQTLLSNLTLKSSEAHRTKEEFMKINSPLSTNSTSDKLQATKIDKTSKSVVNKTTKSSTLETTFEKYKSTVTTSTEIPSSPTEENFIDTDQLLLEEEPKRGDEHIIFLETSCILGETNNSKDHNKTGFDLKPRTACAIESAARMNSIRKVYVIYSCPIVGAIESSTEYVKQMFQYPNVRIWKLNVTEYFKHTPLEKWDFYKKMNASKWPQTHSSDVLRYLSLWKYGGTYLDTDFIIVKSLDALGSNFVGAQFHDYIANGALNFRAEGVGQVVAHLCIRDLQEHYNGTIWGMIGPTLITRVMRSLCGQSEIELMTKEQCLGFTVYPPEVFYKIMYDRNTLLFDENLSNKTMQELDGSFGVHFWNKLTSSLNVIVGSKQPYGLLAEEYCPLVYSNCGKVF